MTKHHLIKMNDDLCPSHRCSSCSILLSLYVSLYSIIHLVLSECENKSKEEILDRSNERSIYLFHCIVIISYFTFLMLEATK